MKPAAGILTAFPAFDLRLGSCRRRVQIHHAARGFTRWRSPKNPQRAAACGLYFAHSFTISPTAAQTAACNEVAVSVATMSPSRSICMVALQYEANPFLGGWLDP